MKTLSYGRQWISDGDIEEVVKVLRGDWLTMGPTVDRFERALADYAGVKHAVTFSSGTAALHGAMAAAGLQSGDFMLTTALTFAATSNAALYTGAVPFFADIDPGTLCLDPVKAEKKLEEMKTAGKQAKVIAPVSFAGYPFDMPVFRRLADRYGAVLIEDASHAFGGDRGKYKIGYSSCGPCDSNGTSRWGADMTTLSFHPVKHITTAEGGAVLTQSDEYAKRLRLFRNHGITRDTKDFLDTPDGPWHSEMQTLGYNYRLSEVGCALGLSQMKRLGGFVARRREIAALYREQLGDVPGLTLPPDEEGHAWHLFPLQVEEERRGPLFHYLREHDIRLQVHYRPVPLQPYYRTRFGYRDGDFPEAERFYRRAVSLPMFPLMEDEDVLRVSECIKNFMAD